MSHEVTLRLLDDHERGGSGRRAGGGAGGRLRGAPLPDRRATVVVARGSRSRTSRSGPFGRRRRAPARAPARSPAHRPRPRGRSGARPWRARPRRRAPVGVPLEVAALAGRGRRPRAPGGSRRGPARVGVPRVPPRHPTVRSRPALARASPAGRRGARRAGGRGRRHWFADLNRNREAAQGGEVVSFALCPQVHARDEATILENLESLADMARTARTFAGTAAACPLAGHPAAAARRPPTRASGRSSVASGCAGSWPRRPRRASGA